MSNYHTTVYAMPVYIPDDRSLPQPRVIMSCTVKCCYIQSEVGGGTAVPPRILGPAFSFRAEYPSGPFASHDGSPSSPSRAIVSSFLDDMWLPGLQLDRLRWLDLSTGAQEIDRCLTRDELVSEIARTTSRAVNDPRSQGSKRLKMGVIAVHKVTVSEREMCELQARRGRWLQLQALRPGILEEEGGWLLLSEQRSALHLGRQEGRSPSVNRDMEDVLQRRRVRGSADQERISFDAADESIIDSLKKLGAKGDRGSSSQKSDCVICMEEVAIGEELIRMDCSHEFHTNCIETWLRIHPTCPLCRYKLSPRFS